MVQQDRVTREIVIFLDSDDIAHSNALPLAGDEADTAEEFDLALVLGLVASPALQVLHKILDHGDDDDQEEGEEDGGLATGEGDGGDDLQDADEQEVDLLWGRYCWRASRTAR